MHFADVRAYKIGRRMLGQHRQCGNGSQAMSTDLQNVNANHCVVLSLSLQCCPLNKNECLWHRRLICRNFNNLQNKHCFLL